MEQRSRVFFCLPARHGDATWIALLTIRAAAKGPLRFARKPRALFLGLHLPEPRKPRGAFLLDLELGLRCLPALPTQLTRQEWALSWDFIDCFMEVLLGLFDLGLAMVATDEQPDWL